MLLASKLYQLVFKQNKDRIGRIETKQGITPFGVAVSAFLSDLA